jgi:hypothetical protein
MADFSFLDSHFSAYQSAGIQYLCDLSEQEQKAGELQEREEQQKPVYLCDVYRRV